MDFTLIIAGFAVLIAGAHFLVDGASGLAKRFQVSDLIIGLTIVSLGTSAPELVVNITASVNPASTDLALTNIIGSNLINTFVILGIAALIYPVASQKSSRRFDMPFNLLAPVVVILLLLTMDGQISRTGGIILLLFFVWFMVVLVRKASNNPKETDNSYKPMKVWLALIMVAGGLVGLIGGAQLIVPSATRIAESWGVSQSVIGLTIVALGTSLPELATSAVAAFKKNSDIALGNVLGSNIFNIFLILALSAIINPLPAYSGIYIDLLLTALGGALLLIFVYSSRKHVIARPAGALLVLLYAAFMAWTISTQINHSLSAF